MAGARRVDVSSTPNPIWSLPCRLPALNTRLDPACGPRRPRGSVETKLKRATTAGVMPATCGPRLDGRRLAPESWYRGAEAELALFGLVGPAVDKLPRVSAAPRGSPRTAPVVVPLGRRGCPADGVHVPPGAVCTPSDSQSRARHRAPTPRRCTGSMGLRCGVVEVEASSHPAELIWSPRPVSPPARAGACKAPSTRGTFGPRSARLVACRT